MTNKERLISFLGFAPPANTAEGALLDAGITESEVYTAANSIPLKKVAITVMELLLTTADTSNNVTGFAIKYDRDAVLKRMNLIKGELGLTDESLPTITGKQPW